VTLALRGDAAAAAGPDVGVDNAPANDPTIKMATCTEPNLRVHLRVRIHPPIRKHVFHWLPPLPTFGKRTVTPLVDLWQASDVTDPTPVSDSVARPFQRDEALRRLADEQFDVLVIGGGITGAGVALDAASRGLRTALVEKFDFGSGTSSKSSKLVHGGLRYLQQHEFRLVYENLAERQRLLENAPHLVSPLPFLIPLFGKDGVVTRGVARVYRTALWMYDLTGGMRIGRRHERINRAQALAHLPTLRDDRLVAGFLYWDARTDDARLTLSIIRTAVLDHGAVAANHTTVTSLSTGSDGRVRGVRVTPDGGSPFDIRANVVVNATGVWADQVRSLDEHHDPPAMRPAKGVHITVPTSAFPCDIAAVIPVKSDHRSIFVVSWGDQVYLGTTDTEWNGPLDDPACLPEDVDYIVDAVNAVVTRPISRADVTGVWAGLRPLLAPVAGKHAPSERTADLSRRHSVSTSSAGLITVTGGKLTTYRKMAEDTVDVVAGQLGLGSRRCVTKHLRLRGSENVDQASVRGGTTGVTPGHGDLIEARDTHLTGRYGTEASSVLGLADDRPDLLEPLVPGLAYLRAEAVFAVREEMAMSLSDILDRRTRAVLRLARNTAAAAHDVALLVGPELGWDAERCAVEATAYASAIRADLTRAGLTVEPSATTEPSDDRDDRARSGASASAAEVVFGKERR
jgi:glycerol-3-phosphate dehydrogenase